MNAREICERYEQLYTGAVADILDEKGFRHQCLGKELRPILPERRTAGFAFPALGEATADVSYDCRPEILKLLSAIPGDSMVVFDPGDKRCAPPGGSSWPSSPGTAAAAESWWTALSETRQ